MNKSSSHGTEPASAWVQRWSHLVPSSSRVLDVACGRGRHSLWFQKLGHAVVAVDRSADALDAIEPPTGGEQFPAIQKVEKVLADLEGGPWPFDGRAFDAVVVTNYLWRPLIPQLLSSLAPQGVLIYETFAIGNETVGKPSRPDFLLRPGELIEVCKDLRIVAYEDGFEEQATGQPERFVQRIVAVSDCPPVTTPLPPTKAVRYPLRPRSFSR